MLIFDEFQQIGELKENHAVEAVIRHAVERSQYVSYIFCGSKRHLLNEMFSDKSRPLYHLCDLTTIGRISTSCYHIFLQHMAQLKWQMALTDEVIDEIIHLTENHPYYVNALCRRLWREQNPPTLSTARMAWRDYISQQRDWISNDLAQLTLNRRKVLMALAYQPSRFILGQDFCHHVGLSASSVNKTSNDLQKLDLIYQDAAGFFRLLDPCIAYFIRENSLNKPM